MKKLFVALILLGLLLLLVGCTTLDVTWESALTFFGSDAGHFIILLLLLIVGTLLLLLVKSLLPKLIKLGLKSQAFAVIQFAYKLSENAVDEMGARIHGLRKQAVAVALYEYLPASIYGVPWKLFISQDRFTSVVVDVFEDGEELWDKASEEFLAGLRRISDEVVWIQPSAYSAPRIDS